MDKYLKYFFKLKHSLCLRYNQQPGSNFEGYLVEKWLHLKDKLDLSMPEGQIKTYIRTSIHGYACNFFRDMARELSIPRRMQHLAISYDKLKASCPSLSKAEIANYLSVRVETLDEAIRAYASHTVPLEEAESAYYDCGFELEEVALIKQLSVEDFEKLEQLHEAKPLADIMPELSDQGRAIILSLRPPALFGQLAQV